MLEKGDVDLAWGLLTEQLDALAKNADIATASTPMLGFLALGMTCDPTNNKAVADPKVQEALKYAIDYDGIRSLREGALTPPCLVPIGLPGALDPAKEGYKQDVAKAKQLLSDAGYASGFDATISASSTEILGGVQDSVLAEKLQADFGDVGVNVTLDIQDEDIFRPKYRSGDTQMVIGGWYVGYPTAFDILDNWGPAGTVSIDRFRWKAPNHPAIALLERSPPDRRRRQADRSLAASPTRAAGRRALRAVDPTRLQLPLPQGPDRRRRQPLLQLRPLHHRPRLNPAALTPSPSPNVGRGEPRSPSPFAKGEGWGGGSFCRKQNLPWSVPSVILTQERPLAT